jgi:hypothetical protein
MSDGPEHRRETISVLFSITTCPRLLLVAKPHVSRPAVIPVGMTRRNRHPTPERTAHDRAAAPTDRRPARRDLSGANRRNVDPESKGGAEASVRVAKADLVPTEANL